MTLIQKKLNVTPEEYLEFERTSEIKHEYFDGEVFAMTGASANHNRISLNISGELRSELKGGSCEVFPGDMRIKIQENDKYTYPDVSIVCGKVELEKIKGVETLLNPIIIIEVLSSSTEAYDRGKKFQHYRLLPTLQEYILVSQSHCLVERYIRSDGGKWIYFSYEEMKQAVDIESIKCELPLSEIYSRVEFENYRENSDI